MKINSDQPDLPDADRVAGCLKTLAIKYPRTGLVTAKRAPRQLKPTEDS
jgi:hypothetical protein